MEQVSPVVTHSEGEYIAAVERQSPASTKEVADAVGVTRQGADYRLRKLESEGKIRGEMVGNSLVWMPAEDPD